MTRSRRKDGDFARATPRPAIRGLPWPPDGSSRVTLEVGLSVNTERGAAMMVMFRAMPVRSTPPLFRVFIGGLALATETELRDAFVEVGVSLERIEVVRSASTGCSRGFAFVVVSRPAVGAGAQNEDDILDLMRSAVVLGRTVTVHRVPVGLESRVAH